MLLRGNASFFQVQGFPFEIFGIFTLLVMFLLAATSHDFWLRFLTPPVWKALHMAFTRVFVRRRAYLPGRVAGGGEPLLAIVDDRLRDRCGDAACRRVAPTPGIG